MAENLLEILKMLYEAIFCILGEMFDLYSMQERYLQTGLAKKPWQPSCKFNDIVSIKTFSVLQKEG